jgi:hypothetical protein
MRFTSAPAAGVGCVVTVVDFANCLTLAVSSRGERMRASGLLHCDVRHRSWAQRRKSLPLSKLLRALPRDYRSGHPAQVGAHRPSRYDLKPITVELERPDLLSSIPRRVPSHVDFGCPFVAFETVETRSGRRLRMTKSAQPSRDRVRWDPTDAFPDRRMAGGHARMPGRHPSLVRLTARR